MRAWVAIVLAGWVWSSNCQAGRPNVLVIAVVDLNDWVGCIGDLCNQYNVVYADECD